AGAVRLPAPSGLALDPDRADLFADPCGDRRIRHRVDVRPARPAVLKRNRRIEHAAANSPAPRSLGKWSVVDVGLPEVHGIRIVLPVSVGDDARGYDIGDPQPRTEDRATEPQSIVVRIEALPPEAAFKERRRGVAVNQAQV